MSKRETMTEKLRRMNAERQAAADATMDAPPPVEAVHESHLPDKREADIRISENDKSDVRYSDVHPAQGGRGDFLKVTVTMDPDDFQSINAEMVRRKRAKEKGAQLSGCIREAIRFWRAAGMPRQE